VLSRVVFGGFWALVTVGLTIAALAGLAAGRPGGLLGLPLAALTGLYSRHISRRPIPHPVLVVRPGATGSPISAACGR
jgi:hypothetical protein